MPLDPDPYVLVATIAKDDATTTLFFRHISGQVPLRLAEFVPRSVRHPLRAIRGEISLAAELSGAAAFIVNRGLFEFANVIGAARSCGIPCYYFVDDNFIVLRDEGQADGRHGRAHTIANVRRALGSFAGVLCATEALREYFLANGLHPKVSLYPPVAVAPAHQNRPSDHRLRLAFFGGAHRREPFTRVVFPAICRLAQQREVVLFAAGVDGARLTSVPGLTVETLPYDRDYSRSLEAMARHHIDILVHPSSHTRNNEYKNPHVLINARTLGAVPVFSDAPPYDALADHGVCLLTEDTEPGWFTALSTLGEADVRERMSVRIAQYCDQYFNGAANIACLSEIIAQQKGRAARPSAARLAIRLAGGLVADMTSRAVSPRT